MLIAQWIECQPGFVEVMGSICVRNSDFFLCPTFVSCWSPHFSHFITKLKIHHLYTLITHVYMYNNVRSTEVLCSHGKPINVQFHYMCAVSLFSNAGTNCHKVWFFGHFPQSFIVYSWSSSKNPSKDLHTFKKYIYNTYFCRLKLFKFRSFHCTISSFIFDFTYCLVYFNSLTKV